MVRQQLNVLSKITTLMIFEQRKMILDSLMSHFSYCLAIWVFQNKKDKVRLS